MARYPLLPILIALLPLLLAACSVPTSPEAPSPPASTAAAAPPTPIPTATAIPPTSTPVPMPTPMPSPTPLPTRITTAQGVEMVLIPAGEFTMGLDDGLGDERPAHPVYLDDYYIDLTETTNRQYRACVEDGACEPPQRTDCCTEFPGAYIAWPDYFENPAFDDYPVIFLRWLDAAAYCEWRGARLPSEAEWEKAARGTDGRIYPWGNEPPAPGLLNFYWPPGTFAETPLYTTAPVGSYPAGASPYGVLDMAGSVYEWVQDWYAPDYYASSPYENPTGPAEGFHKVSRGGSFFNQAFRQRAVGRNNAWLPVDSFHFDGGVRCADDVPPG